MYFKRQTLKAPQNSWSSNVDVVGVIAKVFDRTQYMGGRNITSSTLRINIVGKSCPKYQLQDPTPIASALITLIHTTPNDITQEVTKANEISMKDFLFYTTIFLLWKAIPSSFFVLDFRRIEMQGEVELEERGPSGHMYIKIMIQFLSKIYLFTHVYFIQKYKIENTFRITFQIPVLSLGITYKLQHVFVACGRCQC